MSYARSPKSGPIDVIILGSGMAGSVLGAVLARNGVEEDFYHHAARFPAVERIFAEAKNVRPWLS